MFAILRCPMSGPAQRSVTLLAPTCLLWTPVAIEACAGARQQSLSTHRVSDRSTVAVHHCQQSNLAPFDAPLANLYGTPSSPPVAERAPSRTAAFSPSISSYPPIDRNLTPNANAF